MNWTKEFDNKFINLHEVRSFGTEDYRFAHDEIKQFISDLLSSFLKDIVPEEGLSNDPKIEFGYHTCRSRILERAREYGVILK